MYLCLSLVRCSHNMIFVDPIFVTPAPPSTKTRKCKPFSLLFTQSETCVLNDKSFEFQPMADQPVCLVCKDGNWV